MARIGDFQFPMTMDSGAEVTLVPKEFVSPSSLTGGLSELGGARADWRKWRQKKP